MRSSSKNNPLSYLTGTILFASTIFLSSFLLFQVQPMIAKMILQWFGGSAAVWTTCMLFFQMGLLGGYVYAHWSIRRLKPKAQMLLHVILIAASLAVLPVSIGQKWKPSGDGDPILNILGLLAASVGLPYFLLSTTNPLLQTWYARTYKEVLPYRFFSLSNLASLIGLLAYPFFIEPEITLRQQSIGWSFSYALFAGVCIASALYSIRGKVVEASVEADRIGISAKDVKRPAIREQGIWLLLSACPSVLLLSVTNHLTQNVAAIPFLWILPLILYLLSFVLCFDRKGWYNRNLYMWLLTAALGLISYGLTQWTSNTSIKLVIASYCISLFACCMFCHGELARRKPAPQHLTSFYLMLSLGGAFGGVFVGLFAPKVFQGFFELPLGIIFCALLLFLVNYRRSWTAVVVCSILTIGVLIASGFYIFSFFDGSRIGVRNFYGALKVNEYSAGTEDEHRTLIHGTVTHGVQFTSPSLRNKKTTYYGPSSGVGLAIKNLQRGRRRVGIIGLGAGSLAAYARQGDVYRFYEINPQVEVLARKEFFYLSKRQGNIEVMLGDGRLLLEREPDQQYDLLVVDAFSGDSIPVHLLTVQAAKLYFRHLKPDGILALHITNSHLDLAPVAERISSELGKEAVLISDDGDDEEEIYGSDWVLLASKSNLLNRPPFKKAAIKIEPRLDLSSWTDDYNNLFQVLKY